MPGSHAPAWEPPCGVHSHAGAWERERYVSHNKFKDVYEQAGQTRAALREFINCFRKYEKCKVVNR